MAEDVKVAENDQTETKEVNVDDQLNIANAQLQGVNNSLATAQELIKGGNVKIVDESKEVEEGQEPLTLTVKGEIMSEVLSPVVRVLNYRKENLVNVKERLLAMKEAGQTTVTTTAE